MAASEAKAAMAANRRFGARGGKSLVRKWFSRVGRGLRGTPVRGNPLLRPRGELVLPDRTFRPQAPWDGTWCRPAGRAIPRRARSTSTTAWPRSSPAAGGATVRGALAGLDDGQVHVVGGPHCAHCGAHPLMGLPSMAEASVGERFVRLSLEPASTAGPTGSPITSKQRSLRTTSWPGTGWCGPKPTPIGPARHPAARPRRPAAHPVGTTHGRASPRRSPPRTRQATPPPVCRQGPRPPPLGKERTRGRHPPRGCPGERGI